MTDYAYKISVITATYNAMGHLPRLVESLRKQEDKDFEWIVADGASTDGTLDYLRSIDDLNIKITSQEDFGIYDALNRGIKACSGEFYLVMGADDVLYPNGIKDYKAAITDDVDVVTAAIDKAGKVVRAGKGPAWLYGFFEYVSGHSVGAVFRVELHNEMGFYTHRYPIVADQLFVISLSRSRYCFKVTDAVVGRYSKGGFSGRNTLGYYGELYMMQIELEGNKLLQTILFFVRLVRCWAKI